MLVILDRDGVINFDSPDYIKSPEEWQPIPGSLNAIAQLNQAGHSVVVATNQSGVGRGYYTEQTLVKIHDKMLRALEQVDGHIDKIYYCPHIPQAGCDCRKPKPGLLHQIKADFPKLFNNAVMVGDSLRDIQAAQAANCKAVLVKTGNGKTIDQKILVDVAIYKNLAEFVFVTLNAMK